MERKSRRSERYQHIFLESVYPSEMLESFPNEESIYKRLNPFSYNDSVAELEEELKVEFWRIVETQLTDRQKSVIKLYVDGYTQMEIAGVLHVNQSSITKSIHGNVDYKKGRRVYGGIHRRLKKIIEQDDRVKDILRKISALRDESWL